MQVGSFDHLIMVAHEEMAPLRANCRGFAGRRAVCTGHLNPARIPALWQTALRQIRWVCFWVNRWPTGRAAIRNRLRSFSFSKTSGNSPAPMRRRIAKIRITYLHELGHYFGMDEDDLEARGLD